MNARVLVLVVLCSAPLSAQGPPALDGPDADVVRSACLGCHQSDLIVAQRLTRAAWDREIAKMERWGARLSEADRVRALTYLTGRFGADDRAARDVSETDPGEVIYRAACRSCHDDDLTRQQQLSAADWGRTIDKMARWGARVEAEQKDPLVRYLVSQWGPRK